MMTDDDIRKALAGVPCIYTLSQEVRNDITYLDKASVWVRSERTKTEREIPFESIRLGFAAVWNGAVAGALKDHVEKWIAQNR